MNFRSRKLTEDILKGTEIWSSRVYTTFLQIPAQILPSNSKIVCLVLQCLAQMKHLQSQQLLDFNNEAMSLFTGIPTATLNRILSKIQFQVTAANDWLIENNFTERISLIKIKQFGSATIYNYQHTPPVEKEIFNAQISEIKTKAEKPAAKRKNINEFYIDVELKEKSLLKTGFDLEDLKGFFKHPLDKINRNVKYFIDEYQKKNKPASFNLLKLTFQHDWGRKYLSDHQKAIEYLVEINEACKIIDEHLTPDIREKIKKAYKFEPAADPAIFKMKSDVKTHCKAKINSLPDLTIKALHNTAAAYAQYLKYNSGFIGRTEESLNETALFAALQIIHGAINMKSVINYKIAA